MILLIAYLALALVVSFLCSIMEAVLLSTPQAFLMVKQEAGKKWAFSFVKLKEEIDKPLSAILSLNTVAHTIGAAGVGAQATKIFGEVYFGIVSAVLTVLILIFSEIIPKTIGARYSKSLAKITVYIIKGMIVLTYPLVLLSALITKVFSRKESEQTTSREEIAVLTNIGTDEGVFTENENMIIQNILQLKNIKVTEVLTPRVVLVTADQDLTLEEFISNKNYLRFSRIPVYSGSGENIKGFVFSQTVLEKVAEKQYHLKLADIMRPILVVPNTIRLSALWAKLLESKEHIALIIDEYGGIDGVVTMEDIFETLLGLEIIDEKDTITDMQKYARNRWQARQAKYNLLDDSNKH